MQSGFESRELPVAGVQRAFPSIRSHVPMEDSSCTGLYVDASALITCSAPRKIVCANDMQVLSDEVQNRDTLISNHVAKYPEVRLLAVSLIPPLTDHRKQHQLQTQQTKSASLHACQLRKHSCPSATLAYPSTRPMMTRSSVSPAPEWSGCRHSTYHLPYRGEVSE